MFPWKCQLSQPIMCTLEGVRLKTQIPALTPPAEVMRRVPQGAEPLSICFLFVNDGRTLPFKERVRTLP